MCNLTTKPPGYFPANFRTSWVMAVMSTPSTWWRLANGMLSPKHRFQFWQVVGQVARSSSVSMNSGLPRNGPLRMVKPVSPPSFVLPSARFKTKSPVDCTGLVGVWMTDFRYRVCGGLAVVVECMAFQGLLGEGQPASERVLVGDDHSIDEDPEHPTERPTSTGWSSGHWPRATAWP